MANLNRQERTTFWALRIKSADDPRTEVRKVRTELESLVYTLSHKPITKEDKVELLTEVRTLLASGKKADDGRMILEAADNSGILDIIDSVIADIKG